MGAPASRGGTILHYAAAGAIGGPGPRSSGLLALHSRCAACYTGRMAIQQLFSSTRQLDLLGGAVAASQVHRLFFALLPDAATRMRILESRRLWFPPLGRFLTISKSQAIVRIRVYDETTQRIRHGWLRLGSFWWGVLDADAVEVRWEDA